MEPNHSLISGLRRDTASTEDPVERRITKATGTVIEMSFMLTSQHAAALHLRLA